MPSPILHHYDASPFTLKALRMLGLKRLAWRSVTTPMMPPKDDLLALTGGYRGTPVMQVGADVYVDTQMIAAELERRFPQPSLYPARDAGLCHALVKWSDAFFRTGLRMTVALTASAWPDAFREDRRGLFPDLDFDTAAEHLAHDSAQFRAHASFLEQQLADGRPFLTGADPSLADIQACSIPWFARPHLPIVEKLWSDFPLMRRWEQRVDAMGEGTREPIAAAEALAEAQASKSTAQVRIDAADAQQLDAGRVVEIAAEDSRRGVVCGEVVIAAANHIAVRRHHPACGEVVVHFPRLGYRVRPL